MLPQVEEVINDFQLIHLGKVNASVVKEVAEQYLVFTAPVLLLFVEGKEFLRESRIVHINLLREKINRIYNAISD